MNQSIVDIIQSAKSEKDLPELVEKLRSFSDEDLFDTLFELSIQNQQIGRSVAFAGYALYELNPRCSLSAKAATEALLKEWDVSIEEVVFYLMRQFGLEAMKSARREIMAEHGDPPKRLETIRYWGNIWLEKMHAIRH